MQKKKKTIITLSSSLAKSSSFYSQTFVIKVKHCHFSIMSHTTWTWNRRTVMMKRLKVS